jgi:hypothetical protein
MDQRRKGASTNYVGDLQAGPRVQNNIEAASLDRSTDEGGNTDGPRHEILLGKTCGPVRVRAAPPAGSTDDDPFPSTRVSARRCSFISWHPAATRDSSRPENGLSPPNSLASPLPAVRSSASTWWARNASTIIRRAGSAIRGFDRGAPDARQPTEQSSR